MRNVDNLHPGRWSLVGLWPFGLARAERLLDHRLPTDDPVARLLADASREVQGPVRGEEEIALAYRTAPQPVTVGATGTAAATAAGAAAGLVSTLEAGPSRTVLPRYPARTPIAAPRMLALKVAVIGLATVAVGGVALAHTVDGLTVPFRTTAEKTLPIDGGSGAVAARGGLIPSSSSSPTGVTTQAGGDGSQNTVLPSATPSPVSSAAAAGARPAGAPSAAAQATTPSRDCQTWAFGPFGPKAQRDAWGKALARLRSEAGGREHVAAYCFNLLHQGAVDGKPFPVVPVYPQYPTYPTYPTYPNYPTTQQYPAYPQYPSTMQLSPTNPKTGPSSHRRT